MLEHLLLQLQKPGYRSAATRLSFSLLSLLGGLILVSCRGASGVYYTDISREPFFHPDGITVLTPQDTDNAQYIQVAITPREDFISGNAEGTLAFAKTALPDILKPLSPVYSITTPGGRGVDAELSIPNDAQPLARLALYQWHEEYNRWEFMYSDLNTERQVVSFSSSVTPISVMLVHVMQDAASVGVAFYADSGVGDQDFALAFPGGVVIANGELTGEAAEASASMVLPVITGADGSLDSQLVDEIGYFASDYDGIALQLSTAGPSADSVSGLAARLHEDKKRLDLLIPVQQVAEMDLAELAQSADGIWLVAGANLFDFQPGGAVELALQAAVSRVDRRKLGLMVSAAFADIAADGVVTPLGVSDLAPVFGELRVTDGYLDPGQPEVEAGSGVPFYLSGSIESMGYDPALQVDFITYRDEADSLHYVYLTSVELLAEKLQWAQTYGLTGAAMDISADRTAYAVYDAVSALYLGELPAEDMAGITIEWVVQEESGTILVLHEGDLSNKQYYWRETTVPGQYIITARARFLSMVLPLGQIEVTVSEPVETNTADSSSP